MIMNAIFMGVLYYFATCRVWYGFSQVIRHPLSLAPIIGLVFGNMEIALITGATLEMMYLGAIAPGGNIPADEALAACVAIPIAIQADVSPEIAIAIAVPVGLLGVLLDQFRRTFFTVLIHIADKAAEEANAAKIRRLAFLYPLLLAFPLRFIPAFVGNVFGVDAISAFMEAVPYWVTHGLTVAGNILPALGFALTIVIIGKRKLLPFFITGFFIVAYSGINIIGVAIFGFCAALIYTHFSPHNEQED